MKRIVICLLMVLAVLAGSAGAQNGVLFLRDSGGASVDQAFQLKRGAGNAAANSVALNAALRNANQFHTLTFPAGDWYFAEDTTNMNVNGTCILMDGKSGAAVCGQGLYRPENEPGTWSRPATRLIYAGPKISLASLRLSITGASGTIKITGGYRVKQQDVGATLNITGGTNAVRGWFTIVAANTGAGTWTLTDVQLAAPAHIREQLLAGQPNLFGLRYKDYPIIYTVKIALTIAAILYVLPGYRQFPFRISLLAIIVGVVGIILWIWICSLHLEPKLLAPVGLDSFVSLGDRPAFNPLEALKATPTWAYIFLAIRFVGLALVVPIIEEFFLRGFLMRFVQDDAQWWQVPFGKVTPLAAVVGTAVPMLMHPAELLAAFVWFSLVTWLMVRTKNIWDCVAAHSVTNFLLGLYVVTQHQWQLW